MTPHPYDGCADCVERTRRALRGPSTATLMGNRRTTKAELERHAKRFGPALVEETAAELGLDVTVDAAPAKTRRVKGPTLKARVAEHVAAGHSMELIAELENLSPSRARRIIEEVNQ